MSYRTNISNITLERRNQIKGRLDNFATFMWRGENAFDICGAFIIADKRGDLKFYIYYCSLYFDINSEHSLRN